MQTTYTCVSCQKPIAPTEVRVHYDTSGLDGPVDPQPAHLGCYLAVYDPGLPSNAVVVDHIRTVATESIKRGLGFWQVSDR